MAEECEGLKAGVGVGEDGGVKKADNRRERETHHLRCHDNQRDEQLAGFGGEPFAGHRRQFTIRMDI